MDIKRDEAINRTFNTIAHNFEKVFEEIVPRGRAMLTISRDEKAEEIDLSDGRVLKIPTLRYNGVQIKVF